MTTYITFRDIDSVGNLQYYILQRAFPHYLGLISQRPSTSTIIQTPIPGYHLWVIFNGTLLGNMMPSYKDELKNVEAIFNNMNIWYLENRINIEPKKYKKFKANVPIANK